MNKKKIEALSINELKRALSLADDIDCIISENDKEPSWDGHIILYESSDQKKSEHTDRIPIQVKGTLKNDLKKRQISFQVDVDDLKNYLADGGVIYFVVYLSTINGNIESKVYYNCLTPIKLRVLVAELGDQKTKSVKFEQLPSNCDDITTIVINCCNDCKKQTSFARDRLYSLEELEEMSVLEGISISVSGKNLKEKDVARELVKNDVYLYAKIKGGAIPQPLEFVPEGLTVSSEINRSIYVNGKKYYDSYKKINQRNKTTISIGKSTKIILSEVDNSYEFKFDCSADLISIITDIEFMIELTRSSVVYFDDVPFEIFFPGEVLDRFNINEQNRKLIFFKDMRRVFSQLGVDEDIDVSKLEDRDIRYIEYLIQSMVYDKPVFGLKKDLPPIVSIDIYKYKFLIALIPFEKEKGAFYLRDYFTTKVLARCKNEKFQEYEVSQFVLLKVDDYLSIYNLKLDAILPSIKAANIQGHEFDSANIILLRLISAYDKSPLINKHFLDTAYKIAKWIVEGKQELLSADISQINLLQIICRQRQFDQNEIEILNDIKKRNMDKKNILAGIYILLGDKESAKLVAAA